MCTADGLVNLVGCGSLGEVPNGSCLPLASFMYSDTCAETDTWYCGDGPRPDETQVATRSGPAQGGVLCCRDG